MAEETVDTPPPMTPEQIAELIQQNVSSSVKDAFAAGPVVQQQPVQPQFVPQQQPVNPFQEWIDPVVNPRLAQASLASEAAADKADFYTSQEWLGDIDEDIAALAKDDTPEALAEAKAKVRAQLETTFDNMLKSGRGVPRKDILSFVMYEQQKANRKGFTERKVKRNQSRLDADMAKARAAVDIGTGAISNFTPADIHAMDDAKIKEQFGALQF